MKWDWLLKSESYYVLIETLCDSWIDVIDVVDLSVIILDDGARSSAAAYQFQSIKVS